MSIEVERMIPAVGYVFFGQAPFGQLMLEAMRHATGREPVVIARRRLTFHLDPLEVNRNFDWKDRSHKSTELLALNNMAGFGLSPGKLMFQSLPDSSAILERVHRHFVVPGEVDLNKTGYFVDLGQCFSKNGTISGVALVAMCTSPKETTTVNRLQPQIRSINCPPLQVVQFSVGGLQFHFGRCLYTFTIFGRCFCGFTVFRQLARFAAYSQSDILGRVAYLQLYGSRW
ncbi:hypothetical protein AK812_SmicGene40275 [Symbiodinium microadriaticum]|uniref:Uncharacterized protein n=1 Tax=Symbiodinium microadriaticum TaxID=2951 RepID=A0A1Q9C949_SYMMI|nr:hypothetical protein AK812_SmicGene40275 [Symbiodinium microadriaticum]